MCAVVLLEKKTTAVLPLLVLRCWSYCCCWLLLATEGASLRLTPDRSSQSLRPVSVYWKQGRSGEGRQSWVKTQRRKQLLRLMRRGRFERSAKRAVRDSSPCRSSYQSQLIPARNAWWRDDSIEIEYSKWVIRNGSKASPALTMRPLRSGRSWGSFFRQLSTKSLNSGVKTPSGTDGGGSMTM